MRERLIGILSVAAMSVSLLGGCGSQGGTKLEADNQVEQALQAQVDAADGAAQADGFGSQTGDELTTGAGAQSEGAATGAGAISEGAEAGAGAQSDGAATEAGTIAEGTTTGDESQPEGAALGTGSQADAAAAKLAESEGGKSSRRTSAANDPTGEAAVDIDLTEMDSDMVYATVYQLMNEPDDYIGKSIRMSGQFYSTFYEPTGQYYHYVIIADALACCSQGLEFVWGDGSHALSDYPEEEAQVEVVGTFETYTEEGDANLYCHLKDAQMRTL